jgi:acyl-CoA synthetase (AMP-forming)/AMP-acid ligase II
MTTQLNIAHGLRQFAVLSPGAAAVRDGSVTVTYAELHDRSNRLAQALLAGGVEVGDRVGVLLYNSVAFFETAGALAKAGLVSVALNHKLTAAEITYILGHSGATALILDEALSESAAEAVESLGLKVVLSVGGSSLGRDYDVALSEARAVDPLVMVDEQDPFTIAYTSGTTGKPKGVVISHRSRTLSALLTALEYGMGPGRNTVSVAPMSHGAGFLYAWFAIVTGGSCSVLRQFDAERMLRIIDAHRTNTVFFVPTHAALLRDRTADVIDGYDLSSLDTIFFGAAPLAASIREWTQARFPGVRLHENYGSTESSVATNLRPPDLPRKPGSIGQPFYLTDAVLLDKDRRPVADGERGELFTRSPMNMNGYFDDPAATAACTTDDGYVSGGDIARMDEEGFLFLLDRKKDVIISGGLNVYSREVEQALDRHPGIAGVTVIGTPSEVWGEQVTAFVVTHSGAALDPAELERFCEDSLAAYKRPRAYQFVGELPYNAAGKVRKDELRRLFAAEVDA